MTRCILDASVAAKWFLPPKGEAHVEVAMRLGVTLVTTDERLANATAAHFPVRWLGSIA